MEYLLIAAIALGSYLLAATGWKLAFDHILMRWDDKIEGSLTPLPKRVEYFGGPLDGRVDLMEKKQKPFFFTPYVPEEEDKRGEQFGQFGGQPLHVPNLAYYREVQEDQYFYVRDISHDEYAVVTATGNPPPIEAPVDEPEE